jgi:hypothetical protein
MFSQGYIGVSNNVKKRWYGHKLKPQNGHFSNAVNKYGWDNLVKKVILIGEEKYCLDVELKLRPEKKIGWNLVAGMSFHEDYIHPDSELNFDAIFKATYWDADLGEMVELRPTYSAGDVSADEFIIVLSFVSIL